MSHQSKPPRLAVLATQASHYEKAHYLALQLSLPLIFQENHDFDYWIVVTENLIGIQSKEQRTRLLKVDFLTKKIRHRLQSASKKNERLIQALGSDLRHKKIIDATGGLGYDSLLMAKFASHVVMLERSSLIFHLLKDGLTRAESELPVVSCIQLIHADAITWLAANPKTADIIYLDPMFGDTQKSALSKMEMQLFQNIIGDDSDAEILFQRALTCATNRVVVKRSRKAKLIAKNPIPSYSLKGSSSRFDVYIQSAIPADS